MHSTAILFLLTVNFDHRDNCHDCFCLANFRVCSLYLQYFLLRPSQKGLPRTNSSSTMLVLTPPTQNQVLHTLRDQFCKVKVSKSSTGISLFSPRQYVNGAGHSTIVNQTNGSSLLSKFVHRSPRDETCLPPIPQLLAANKRSLMRISNAEELNRLVYRWQQKRKQFSYHKTYNHCQKEKGNRGSCECVHVLNIRVLLPSKGSATERKISE